MILRNVWFAALFLIFVDYSACLQGADDDLYIAKGETGILSCCLNADAETFKGYYDQHDQKIDADYMSDKYQVAFDMHEYCYYLRIKNVGVSDVGEYSCKTTEGDSVLYRVLLDPIIEFVPPKQTLFIGEDHVIDANLNADPLPDVIWKKYDGLNYVDVLRYSMDQHSVVQGGSEYDICRTNGSLIIKNVDRSHEGQYKIVLHGKETKEKVTQVTVQQKAKIVRENLAKTTTNGNHHIVKCAAVGIPKPRIEFYDRLQNQIPAVPTIDDIDRENKVIATLSFTTNHSTVMCNASNKYNIDVATIGLDDNSPLRKIGSGADDTWYPDQQNGAKYEAAAREAEANERMGFFTLVGVGLLVAVIVLLIIVLIVKKMKQRKMKKDEEELSEEEEEGGDDIIKEKLKKAKKSKEKDIEKKSSTKSFPKPDKPPSKTDKPPSRSDKPPSRPNKPPSRPDKPPSRPVKPPSKPDKSTSRTEKHPSTQDNPPSRSGKPHSRSDKPHSRQGNPSSKADKSPSRPDKPSSREDKPSSSRSDKPSSNGHHRSGEGRKHGKTQHGGGGHRSHESKSRGHRDPEKRKQETPESKPLLPE